MELGNSQISKNMKKTLLIISAASLLLVGCAKEQLVEKSSYTGPVTVVSATFESLVEDGATKAEVADAGTFTWQNGDEAAFAGESAYLQAQNSSTTATASFSFTGALASPTYGIFPFDLTTDQSVNDGKVKVPTSRAWAENQTNVAMYATYASNKFSFAHLGGLVKVTIINVPTTATSFVFKTDGWKINGVFDITTDSESNKVISTNSTTTDSEMEYTLTFTAPSSEGTSKDFYVPLPTGTYNKGFAVYLKNNADNIISQFKGSTPQTVNRKSFLRMPAITLASASIEDVYKDALVETIPAGYSGDYLLPETDKLILKIKASGENHDITLKYKGENKPTKLEIKVFDGDTETAGNFDAKLLGDLPYTHVDFTYGHIDHTSLTTSSSTLAVINPATVGTLTVTGGNVVLKGATVNMIEVAEGAVADASSSTPVEIKMEKYTAGSTVQIPKVTGSVVAKANVQVAPVAGETVTVVKVGSVTVADTGEGDVEEKENVVSVSTFEDFENAVGNVVAGQTIKVTANISDAQGITVAEGKNFTVDFGGHTYTCESNPAGSTGTKNQVFQLLKNSTITFKNGTIDVAEAAKENFRFIIQNYADLTLENVTIDGTGLSYNEDGKDYTYALSNNCGLVELKGKTSIIASTESELNNYAFDVCKYSDYNAPTVTWNSTGDVTGIIELSGGNFVVAKDLKVTTPIRSNSGASTMTINEGVVVSPVDEGFRTGVKTKYINTSNEVAKGVVVVNRSGELTIKGSGKIAAKNTYAAVMLTEKGESEANDAPFAKLTVNEDVTLEGYYYGIGGNGVRHNTEITVKGGTITGTCNTEEYGNGGIYHPQEGKLTITGGIITGLEYAVEVRSGTEVKISGGTFTSTASMYSCVKNGSGSTTVGAALAIAQHTTKHPINVTISGGTFTGPRAVALEDIEGNKDGDNVNVSISGGTYTATEYALFNNYAGTTINISGGKFESTGASGIAVYARLGSVNITGGEFTNNSNSEATLHVGCPDAKEASLQPKLTISGTGAVVKNNATGDYPYKSGWKALTVNMANELTYKAVEISGGKFIGQKPESDDSYTEGQEYKRFLVEGYNFSGDATNGWIASQQN